VGTRYTEWVTQLLTPTNPQKAGAILALDYGRARIGMAVADVETRLAKPLATLERINRNEDMRRLRELARELGVRQILVGLPLRLDGTHGEMAEEASRFAERVRKQIGVPVEMVDERLTSWEAERLLEEQGGRVMKVTSRAAAGAGTGRNVGQGGRDGGRDGGKFARKAKPVERMTVDAMAAAVMLKEYLER
jgi:putative Holliday junction resolvase